MPQNIVVKTAESGPVAWAAALAAKAGDDLGLVLTAIDFAKEKVSGGRIEEERDYAGIRFNTFDEPIFIGSAIAQLAGHAEAVVVDGIEDWAARLLKRFPDLPIERDAEIASLTSVMHARMADLILIVRPAVPADAATREVLRIALVAIEAEADAIVELRGVTATALKGTLPR